MMGRDMRAMEPTEVIFWGMSVGVIAGRHPELRRWRLSSKPSTAARKGALGEWNRDATYADSRVECPSRVDRRCRRLFQESRVNVTAAQRCGPITAIIGKRM